MKLKRVDKYYKYPGSTVTEGDTLDEDVTHRVQSGKKNVRMIAGVIIM